MPSYTLVIATPTDGVDGISIHNPASPLTWDDLGADAAGWVNDQPDISDDQETYVLNDGATPPPGRPVYILKRPKKLPEYQVGSDTLIEDAGQFTVGWALKQPVGRPTVCLWVRGTSTIYQGEPMGSFTDDRIIDAPHKLPYHFSEAAHVDSDASVEELRKAAVEVLTYIP